MTETKPVRVQDSSPDRVLPITEKDIQTKNIQSSKSVTLTSSGSALFAFVLKTGIWSSFSYLTVTVQPR